MLFQIKSYFNFLLKSTNQHGVHSPFVFKLLTECFYDKTNKPWYSKVRNYRRSLLKNNTSIAVKDFGAGSKALDKKQRNVASIAKNAGITLKRAQLLGRLVSYFDIEHTLEIGTSLGISTAAMHLANPKNSITTLEGCPNTAQIAKNSFETFELKNITIVIGSFAETLPKVLKNKTYDFIYFDGNHQKQATIDYFLTCLPHTHNETVFIFDDIYWSEGMSEAWQYIKNHPSVTVSIDTFYWGIVFFRKEQEKEAFVVRV
ncbi:class I SAM-dependent methyltransferase [Aureibaculum sp. A20]|uniref:Class I SAM-dependent methyltransferase n=1 Tax=Aureibaculum flavum TaxID=2795986 RepID=A0ABS0WRN5_9FLAO|nr:class I SAM-dependent methyltransferase [Aureibaculum flavum]MBJ2174591.1 class I SAM-dependent methyltransferase [Aureibaculum flavum]